MQVRLDDALSRRLRREADRRGVPATRLATVAIAAALDRMEALERDYETGMVLPAPADLLA